MSRSFINLRRALLGVSCAVTFGFGATDALARTRPAARLPQCTPDQVLCRSCQCTSTYYCAPASVGCEPCGVE